LSDHSRVPAHHRRTEVPVIGEVLVELNPDGPTVWRARVEPLNLVVEGDTILEAENAALAAIAEARGQVSDDLRVRVRFGTRAERMAAGWVPPRPDPTTTHQ
jgi:hypothetical protein